MAFTHINISSPNLEMPTFLLINSQLEAAHSPNGFCPSSLLLSLSSTLSLSFLLSLLTLLSHIPPLRTMWDRVMLSDSEEEAPPTIQSLQVQPGEGGGEQENKEMGGGEDSGMKW